MNTSVEQLKKSRWGYLALGVVLLLFLGLIYAWSVFRAPLEKEFGWSKSQTSVTFSISMMMFCLGGLVSGLVTGKKGARFTMIFCALFLTAGFIAASRVQSLIGIYLSYGVLCGFGVGLGYNATISTIVKWFPDQQGLVSGVNLMGFGFGGMLLGTVGASLIVSMGWRTTFVVFGIAFGIIMLIGAFLLRPANPEFVASVMSSSKKASPPAEEVTYRDMLKRKNFWLYFLWAIVLSAAGLAIINSSTPFAATIVGDDLTRAAAIAGIVSIFNGIGRVIFGTLFDTKGYRVTMVSVCFLYAVSGLVLMAAFKSGSLPILIASFVLIGLSYGGVTPTNSAFTAYFFGRKNYALNFSITNLNLIIASYVGPLCGGDSYMRTFAFILVFAAIGLVIALSVRKPVLTALGQNA